MSDMEMTVRSWVQTVKARAVERLSRKSAPPLERAWEAEDALADLRDLEGTLVRLRNQALREAVAEGRPQVEVAEEFGISRQRLHQLLKMQT